MNRRLIYRAACLVSIALAFALLMWTLSRPPGIVEDINGWRQAETQQMAIFQSLPGSKIWMPQVAWGGPGPSYVEAEMQIYTGLVGALLKVFGQVEWPGQLVSLFCVAGAILTLSAEVARRYDLLAGAVAAVAAFASRGVVAMSTAVQPDAMALFLVAISFVAFLRYVETQKRSTLALVIVATTLAGLCKPPALHIGITQFAYVLLTDRKLLRRKELWFGWFAIVSINALYLWHAYSLALEFGNSFGVITGDRKYPTWRSLIAVGLHLATLKNVAHWGITYAGVLAAVYLAWRRKFPAEILASLLGYGVYVLVAQRLTSHAIWSSHYHIVGILPGMMLVAAAINELTQRPTFSTQRRNVSLALVGALAGWALSDSINYRRSEWANAAHEQAFTESLRQYIKPGQTMVFRSSEQGLCEPFWGGGPNNFEDPRTFYSTKTTGWVLPSDDDSLPQLISAQLKGADFYLEPNYGQNKSLAKTELNGWLAKNAALVLTHPDGRLFRLN